MKGSLGIIVAVFLGLVALSLNWYYLYSKTSEVKTVSFIGIKPGVTIRAGQPLREENFEPVAIPVNKSTGFVDRLRQYAYLYDDVKTVANIIATRDYEGGDLVMRHDYRTPKPELDLAPNERVLLIAVDGRNFVTDLVDPGDLISFVIPRVKAGAPTPVGVDGPPEVRGDVSPDAAELIGPFVVASLGSRLGSAEVAQANRGANAQQERIVGIRVTTEGASEKLERKAMLLLDRLEQSNGRNIQVVLHPRPKR